MSLKSFRFNHSVSALFIRRVSSHPRKQGMAGGIRLKRRGILRGPLRSSYLRGALFPPDCRSQRSFKKESAPSPTV